MGNLSNSDFTFGHVTPSYSPNIQLEPFEMQIELFVDIKNRMIEGSNTIKIKANVDKANKIEIDAVNFEYVKIVSDDLEYDYDGRIIHIKFNRPLMKNDVKEIKILYQVIDPVGGLYFSYPDDKYPDLPIFAASDHETERARYWLPCVDYPNIRTKLVWKLTSQNDYTILANGKLIDDKDNNDGTKTVQWEHDFPCPSYLACIALGEFIEYKDEDTDAGNGKIPVAYYTNKPNTSEDLKITFGKTPKIIKWLVDKIKTPFAWDKYYQFALLDFEGAMENESLVSWSDYSVLDKASYPERGYHIDTVNVHEMAHTYFGDMLVMKHFAHAWLKESWATYIADVWLADTYGEDHYKYDMYLNAIDYFDEADNNYVRSIVNNKYNSSWDLFDNHLYPGGAWRLHMLNMLLGDNIFWAGVRDYVQSFSGKVVETSDFQRKLEEHSGVNLTQFFEQWLLEPKGYPDLKIKYKYNNDKKQIKFTIIQKQIKDKDPKSLPFIFDLDIAWKNDLQSEYQIETVSIKNKSHIFLFDCLNRPKLIRIDPIGKILHKLEFDPGNELNRNQLQSDIIGKIHASQLLAKSGSQKNINAIFEAYKQEQFWGVKVEYLNALGKANSLYAIKVLIEILKIETDPLVQYAVAKNCGKYKDGNIREALINFLKTDIGPEAIKYTLEAIANQKNEDDFDLIKSYLEYDSHADSVKQGVYSALGKYDSSDVTNFLLEKIEYGKESWRVRIDIIKSLADIAKRSDDRLKAKIVERLIGLTLEASIRERKVIARAFKKLNARNSIETLNAMKNRHVDQESVEIDKIIFELSTKVKTSKEVSDLKKQVEELTDRIRKMDYKIQELENK